MAEEKYINVIENFEIKLFEKTKDGIVKFEPENSYQINHFPQVGNYFVPLGSKIAFKILAVIHDDIKILVVVENDQSEFSEIGKFMYGDLD